MSIRFMETVSIIYPSDIQVLILVSRLLTHLSFQGAHQLQSNLDAEIVINRIGSNRLNSTYRRKYLVGNLLFSTISPKKSAYIYDLLTIRIYLIGIIF